MPKSRPSSAALVHETAGYTSRLRAFCEWAESQLLHRHRDERLVRRSFSEGGSEEATRSASACAACPESHGKAFFAALDTPRKRWRCGLPRRSRLGEAKASLRRSQVAARNDAVEATASIKLQYALEDLAGIADYIRESNPAAAIAVRAAVLDALQNLVLFPKLGRKQSLEGVRKLVARKFPYLVYYTIEDARDEIIILTIQHPAQDREYSDV